MADEKITGTRVVDAVDHLLREVDKSLQEAQDALQLQELQAEAAGDGPRQQQVLSVRAQVQSAQGALLDLLGSLPDLWLVANVADGEDTFKGGES